MKPLKLLKKWYEENNPKCPRHKHKLIPMGYYKMVCEVPCCTYHEHHMNGNVGYYGRGEEYMWKHKEQNFTKNERKW